MGYPISGLNKTGPKYKHPEYLTDSPVIPHGISVALTGPSVFKFTAPSSPSRHREVLALFAGSDNNYNNDAATAAASRLPEAAVGPALFDALGVPRGLAAVGYGPADLDRLVEGTVPQRRVLDLAPGIGGVGGVGRGSGDVTDGEGCEHLRTILEGAMRY